jgi:hypothetical protein
LFTLQMMLHYFEEAKEGDALAVSRQLAAEHDDKRMRVWLDMTAPAARRWPLLEQLLISVTQSDGKRAQSRGARDEGCTRSARQGAKGSSSSACSRSGVGV